MKDFEHRPLDTNSSEIRLLRITKAKEDDPIVLEVKHAILDDKLVFNALSYAWGDETPLYDITVRDGSTEASFSVRGNLYAFLKTARKSSDDWSREWIWIDQVCINQKDHTERCHQVGQMGTLYSTAQSTIIWPIDLPLSFRDEVSHNLIFGVEELEVIRTTPVRVLLEPEQTPTESAMRLLEMFTPAMMMDSFATPYWERVWIVQEIVLASQSRVLIEGHVWDFEDFQVVAKILWSNSKHLYCMKGVDSVDELMSSLTVRLDAFGRLRAHKDEGAYSGLDQGWHFVLMMGGSSACTIPLDRIYGMMGLLHVYLRVEPSYTVLSRDLLRNIIQKQIAFGGVHLPVLWLVLSGIFKFWNRFKAGFESIEPVGLIPEQGQVGSDDSIEQLLIAEHNVRLYLKELGTPIPAKMEAFAPSKSIPLSRNLVQKYWRESRRWVFIQRDKRRLLDRYKYTNRLNQSLE